MSYNGNGVFLINTAGQPVVPNTVISSTTFNLLTADLANGLTNAITKDGQSTITANIPFSNFKITGLGAGTSPNDAVRLDQITNGASNVSFGNLAYTGTFTGGTGVINIGSGQIYKDALGGVGIGTTSPLTNFAKLDVNNAIFARPTTTALSSEVKAVASDFFSLPSFTNTGVKQFGSTATGTTAGLPNAQLGLLEFINTSAGLIYTNSGAPIVFGTTAVERMRIDSSGNVGIGNLTNNDTRRLQFPTASGGSTAIESVTVGATDQALVFKTTFSTESEKMRITGSGNVVIGAATSAGVSGRFFDVANAGGDINSFSNIRLLTQQVSSSSTATVDIAKFKFGALVINNNETNAAAYTSFGVGISERMRIDSAGNVGIGTTSPAGITSRNFTVQTAGTSNVSITTGDYSATEGSVLSFVESFGNRNDGNNTFGGRFGATFRKSNGTAISTNACLGYYAFGGQWGTDTSYQSSKNLYAASIVGVAEGAFTSASAMPTAITFRTSSTGESLVTPNTTYGTERMRIDAFGNVGIGTISAVSIAKLTVSNSSTTDSSRMGVSSTTYLSTPSFTGTFLEQGDTATTGTVAGLNKANLGSILFQNCSNALIYTNGEVPLVFGTASADRGRFTGGGNFLLGTSSEGGERLAVHSVGTGTSIRVQNGNSSPYFAAAFYNGSGTLQGYIEPNGSGSTVYATSSDYRLKENVQPMQNALAKIAALNPVTYTWKSNGSEGQGFIAHELQAVVADCVSGEKDAIDADGNPKYQGVDTSFLVATLTAAIKEQQAIISAMETRLIALEA